MKVGIVVFPGSNCDRDVYHVLRDVIGFDTTYIWHNDSIPGNIDALVLPGGFSYGDRLRAGAIAAHSPAIEKVSELAESGVPILGICNGFQILVEAGLLPGALLMNDSLNFMCRWTRITVKNNQTPFTRNFDLEQEIPIPIANSQGRYYVDDATLEMLERNNQIVFRYKTSVNGSSDMIAGVCNKEKNIVGMMPHPERAAESEINPIDPLASQIFQSLCAGATH